MDNTTKRLVEQWLDWLGMCSIQLTLFTPSRFSNVGLREPNRRSKIMSAFAALSILGKTTSI